MRILISGAGVAGLTLAYWLEQAGHTPIVIEKAKTIRTEGYMIDFTGTGWDVADKMGLIPAIRQRASTTELVIYKDKDDNITSQISIKNLLASMNDTVNYAAINRRDIVHILYEAVQDKVEICFGRSLKAVEQTTNAVQVGFNDGSFDEYDLLVGCDGIHSHTRQLVFGDEQQFANYFGYQFAIFEIPPLQYDLGHSYHMYVEPDLQIGIFPTQADKWLVFATFAQKDDSIPKSDKRVKAIGQQLAHVDWYVPELLNTLQSDDYVFWDNITQIQMPQWYDNRVALIGDSAYCPTLISGQGASMAMAGAYFLAEGLAETRSYQEAFVHVDTCLRPHIEKIQASARNFAPTFIPKSNLRIAIINWALRLSGIPIFKQFVGKQFVIDSIL